MDSPKNNGIFLAITEKLTMNIVKEIEARGSL
jgi:hypothetical protein